MTTAEHFRERAAQCRRLARGLLREEASLRDALLSLAQEYEAKAIAAGAKSITEAAVDRSQALPPGRSRVSE